MLIKNIFLIALSTITSLSFIQNTIAQQNTSSQAIQAATTNKNTNCGGDLKEWLDQIAQEAKAQGVSDHSIQELYKARLNEQIIKSDNTQTILTFNFINLLKQRVTNNRLQIGRQKLKEYKEFFDKAEKVYGVPGPVITAFWGLESSFGAIQGNFNILNAVVTLAHNCRRPELFRPQVIALLKLFDKGFIDSKTQGGWAGEIGQIQLLPLNYLNSGVDGDGDGKVDLKNNPADIIMTAARMINELGWKRGQPWLEEVQITGNHFPWQEASYHNRKPIAQWTHWGVSGLTGPLNHDNSNASLILPMGHKGPTFLAYDNFNVFTEWNKSIIYATTVAYFATLLNGAPSATLGNPDTGLSSDEMKVLQEKLLTRGYQIGKVDGISGMLTRDAIQSEQLRLNMPADSWATKELLEKL